MAVYKKKHKKIFSSAPRAKKSVAKAKNENKTELKNIYADAKKFG